MKKVVLFVNMNSFLSEINKYDLYNYACNLATDDNEYTELDLILNDDCFGEADIIEDSIQRGIFTAEDSCKFNLRDVIGNAVIFEDQDYKKSKIKFFLTFLQLLESEIENANEVIKIELITVKYRLMNILDSIFGTTLFMGNYNFDDCFKEEYDFASFEALYFIDEILEYDDDKYNNMEFNVSNLMVYFNNLIRKIFIDTYYKLTDDKDVVSSIKNNPKYGNNISSGFLKSIIEEPKTRTKEIL